MSANNWRQCPKCREKAVAKKQAAAAKAIGSYGQVSPEEYQELADAASRIDPDDIDQTLREYYQLGVDESATFYMWYSCDCQNCDFSFCHRMELPTADKPKRHS